jgi:L-lysine 2,3-aminomutase
MKLNPHPAGQLELNTPHLAGGKLHGIQHKYRKTVLFFPSSGQTCHTYCTYCFRWAQFVKKFQLRISSNDVDSLREYLRKHREVANVLITGGDPMVMTPEVLARCITSITDDPNLEHIESIRIGTTALSYWPDKFLSDPGAEDTLRLFECVVESGKSLAFMAHFTHPRELRPDAVERAVVSLASTEPCTCGAHAPTRVRPISLYLHSS